MVIQSSLILGIIEFRDVVGSIQRNSVENTEKATENRRARLEAQMLQRWSRIYLIESELTQTLEQFLGENRLTLEELNGSQALQQEFLLKMFPECLQAAQDSEATGCFLLMTGESPEASGNVSEPDGKIRRRKPGIWATGPSHSVWRTTRLAAIRSSPIPFPCAETARSMGFSASRFPCPR